MKKIYLSMAVIGLAFAVNASAQQKAPAARKAFERPYGLAGCGLGSMVMGKGGSQILAATTNATFYSQMFGITFNTSNCVDDQSAEMAGRLDQFVGANKVALAGDIARGGGETVQTISMMLGCEGRASQMGAALQRNFSTIFPSHHAPANVVTDAIITTVIQDAELSASCKRVG